MVGMINKNKVQWIIVLCWILMGLMVIPLSITAQVKIKMQKEGGVYTLPCTVNGLQLRFILDTGAAEVNMSLSEATFMLKNGYLDANDLKGSSYSQIANGTLVSNTTLILREVNIGGIILKNINASIIETMDAPLLLGQSVLQKLGPYQINGDELWILNGQNTYANDNGTLDQHSVRREAKVAFDKKLYKVAISEYEQLTKARCANENDIFNLGISYYYTAQYNKAITSFFQLETSSHSWSNSGKCNYYQWIAISYGNIKGELQNALLYLQKAEMVATTENEYYLIYDHYTSLYFRYGYYDSAREYAKKTIDYYGKWKNVKVDYYNPTHKDLYYYYNAVIVGDIESNVIKREKGYKILNKYARQGNNYSKDYLLKKGKYDTRSGWERFQDTIFGIE